MNTIVIKPDTKNDNLEVHFNLWNSDSNNLHFLDIGIMCDNKKQKITIEIPSSKKIKVKDLSNELKEDIRNSIFNCNVDKVTKGAFEILKKSEQKEDMFLLSPIEIPDVSFGEDLSTFKIEVNETKKEEIEGIEIIKKYIRLRIENLDFSKFMIKQDSDSRIFESSYTTNTLIDFRFNDYKLLSSAKLQTLKLEKDNYLKVHFLYMTDVLENIDICSSTYSVRFLERNIWNRYLGLTERKKDMLAYHLKVENCSNASFLIKSQEQKTSVKHLLFYAGVVTYLAIVANFIFSFIPLRNLDSNIRWIPFAITLFCIVGIPLILLLLILRKKK